MTTIALVVVAFVVGALATLGLMVVVKVAQLVLKASIARRAALDSARPQAPEAHEPEPVSAEVDDFVTSAAPKPDASLEQSILAAAERERSKLG